MQHLDDGILNALVDGEVASSELGPIQRHLETCTSCRARFEETRGFAEEADGLVELLEPPVDRPTAVPGAAKPWWRRESVRNLAWAASLFLAVGLGYAAGTRPPASAPQGLDALALEDAATSPHPEALEQATATEADSIVAGDRRSTQAPVPQPSPPGRRADDAIGQMEARRDQVAGVPTEPVVGDERAGARSAEEERPAAPSAAEPQALAQRERQAAPARLSAANQDMAFRAAAESKVEAFTTVTFPEALTVLGGTIRLIDGLVPSRLEAAGETVRVAYVLSDGELLLTQHRVADSINVDLTAPTGFPADSLAALRARIR